MLMLSLRDVFATLCLSSLNVDFRAALMVEMGVPRSRLVVLLLHASLAALSTESCLITPPWEGCYFQRLIGLA